MISQHEAIINGALWLLKVAAIFFLLRGALFFAGFRYTIPYVDDVFWYVVRNLMGLFVVSSK